ncbi:MAG: beta-propeller domain-containing protein [Candidatus Bathyarchaeia archaeon]
MSEIKRRAATYGLAAALTALMLGALCYNLGVQLENQPSLQPSPYSLKTFSSYQELLNFLLKNVKPRDRPFIMSTDVVEYSTTNVQVAGVDEADIVKTDGEFIYAIVKNSVYILKAYPPENATILSKITFENNTYPKGLFISSNGNRLTVLGSKYLSLITYYAYIIDNKAFIYVYDVTNKTNPILVKDFAMSGHYLNSRMIGEYVYAVISQPVYIIYGDVILPKIYSKDNVRKIEATRIYYSNVSEEYYTFTTIVALNMVNENEEPNTLTIMMGRTSNLYVSLNNIYITFHNFNWQTTIYRIRIDKRNLNWEATGTVPGHERNQFSMDEYNGYFRITTARWVNRTRTNDLYVLDMNLTIIGNLTDIAPGESLDSTRFIGKRCYLTTSIQRKDPFFVIDVENPEEPKFLGKLDIPGFTRYLHPYNENHLIGVGIDGNSRVQILMFNVSDVSKPSMTSNFTVPYTSTTPVLWEHKAFLFDKAKELLVIPVYQYSKFDCAYVLDTSGYRFTLKGNITHMDEGIWRYACQIKRALYIEDTLYTLSETKLKMNWLEDLSFINEIVFS